MRSMPSRCARCFETVRMDHAAVHRVEGSEVLVLRDRTVPLLRLAHIIGAPGRRPGQPRRHPVHQ